jgi:peptidoglycan/xylan/chitin deacetylase (PgdA/CDA1 family)
MTNPRDALILLYHRVTHADRDPQMLCVSPENFRQQLEVLRSRGSRIMSLADLVDAIENGCVPAGAVAITFDDGYADNLEQAAPILRQFDAPATVFATTAHTNCDAEFYWDDLDRIFLTPGSLPRQLRLWMADSAVEIDLGEFDYYSHTQARANQAWTILDKTDPTPRHRAYRTLCQAIHQAPLSLRRDAINQLQAWSGLPTRHSHRMLSVDQMRQLVADGLIDIGGHTVDHPILAVESQDSQYRQVIGNKDALTWILGRQPAAFSYPYGTRRDFTAATIDIVKRSGYRYACANFSGQVTATSNPFQLPRNIVRNWNAAEFDARLNTWFASSSTATTPLAKAG